MKDDKQALKGATVTEVNYLGREMSARLASERHQSNDEIEQLKKKRDTLSRDIAREREVHGKTVAHLNKVQEEHEAVIQKWMGKYDEHTEAKAQELEATKKDRAATIKDLGRLQKAYNDMVEVVDEHHKEQERLRLEEEERVRMDAAATVVQSYCRGFLTRKRLRNPPKKKKSGKKKK